MDKKKNYLDIKRFSLKQGADLFGVADIKNIKGDFVLSSEFLDGVNSAVCLGVRLSTGILSQINNEPNKLYFHHYRTANAVLDQLAFKLSNYMQDKGYLALAIPASQILDWQNQKAHLSHKKLGVLAGLGWIGRNNLLVNPKLGSRLRLVSILTNMPLKVDKPLTYGCGSCRLCINVCPAQAIKDEPEGFDHIKCFEKLKEFQRQKLVDQYICGVCVNVCKGTGKHKVNK